MQRTCFTVDYCKTHRLGTEMAETSLDIIYEQHDLQNGSYQLYT